MGKSKYLLKREKTEILLVIVRLNILKCYIFRRRKTHTIIEHSHFAVLVNFRVIQVKCI